MDMRLEQAELAYGRSRAERDEEEDDDDDDNKGWLVEHRAEAEIEASPIAPVLRGGLVRDSALLGQESRTRLKSRAELVGHKWQVLYYKQH
jgi:hypothetical protein